MPEKFIYHVVAVWDESEHLSERRLEPKSEAFLRAYMDAFPEAGRAAESPLVASTPSPMLDHLRITSFQHEGSFLPYTGKNKDLALVKFCTSGLIDQDERFHFVLSDVRHRRHLIGESPLLDDDLCLVVFCTTDHGDGMTNALRYVSEKARNVRVSFLLLRMQKDLGTGDERMRAFGHVLGTELRGMYVRNDEAGLVFELPGEVPAWQVHRD